LSTQKEGGVLADAVLPDAYDKLNDTLKKVHNARVGHWGVRRTMQLLDENFPGHKIKVDEVREYIAKCPICQKNRQGMVDSIKPMIRHLKPPYMRKAIGIDTLTITPPDELGNKYLIVIVVHFSKLAWGYPCATKDAKTLADAIVTFFSIYGMFDTIISDPGSDLTSNLIADLDRYYGVVHAFSLVDRHESNGVEGTNKQILRHIRALVQEERVAKVWSTPTVLPIIFFLINSHISSETGYTPFQLHFGSDEATYFKMPESLPEGEQQHEFIKLLDQNLKDLTTASKKFQDNIVKHRTKDNNPETQNLYQPGDFVLYRHDNNRPLSSKLSSPYAGPYIVISQTKNDVSVRHMSTGVTSVLHVERLKRFVGTREQAIEAANTDYDQYQVNCILGYKGDPKLRSEMQFELLFNAGDTMWKTHCKDIYETVYFEEFCTSRQELRVLLTTEVITKKILSTLNKSIINEFTPNSNGYLNLRFYGYVTYNSFGLPDSDREVYVTPVEFKSLSKNKCDMNIRVPLFKQNILVKHEIIHYYCMTADKVQESQYKLVDISSKEVYTCLKL
jgi:hypothetical protein